MFSWLKPKVDKRGAYPQLAAGECVYVIGDIHGRSDLLDRVHAAIDADREARAGRGETTAEIYLGDYVDRGDDSAGVIERLLRRSRTSRMILLRGNHEEMFEAFLAGDIDPEEWRAVGGMETLMSYGLDVGGLTRAPKARWLAAADVVVPEGHRAFLRDLRDSFSFGGYFFAHAGLRPGVPLQDQVPDDLLWVRDVFLGDPRDHGAVVVHGHTPTMEPEFLPNRINLDTGAYLTGNLTCLMIDSHGPRLLKHVEAAQWRG